MKPCDFQHTSAVPAFHSWTHACMCACRRHGGPCAHRSAPGEPGMLDMWLFLQRKGSGACYSTRRLGMDVVNNPMTFALSVWQETIPVPPPDLIISYFLSQSSEPILMEDVTCTLQSVSMQSRLIFIQLILFLVVLGEIYVCFMVHRRSNSLPPGKLLPDCAVLKYV